MQWYSPAAAGQRWKPYARASEGKAELIRAGVSLGFTFQLAANDHKDASFTVQFTDDVGLRWKIDNDLRLQKLPRSGTAPG